METGRAGNGGRSSGRDMISLERVSANKKRLRRGICHNRGGNRGLSNQRTAERSCFRVVLIFDEEIILDAELIWCLTLPSRTSIGMNEFQTCGCGFQEHLPLSCRDLSALNVACNMTSLVHLRWNKGIGGRDEGKDDIRQMSGARHLVWLKSVVSCKKSVVSCG